MEFESVAPKRTACWCDVAVFSRPEALISQAMQPLERRLEGAVLRPAILPHACARVLKFEHLDASRGECLGGALEYERVVAFSINGQQVDVVHRARVAWAMTDGFAAVVTSKVATPVVEKALGEESVAI